MIDENIQFIAKKQNSEIRNWAHPAARWDTFFPKVCLLRVCIELLWSSDNQHHIHARDGNRPPKAMFLAHQNNDAITQIVMKLRIVTQE
ncbi:hypothetical protein [Gluconobacter wancherniae]|uniref:hypothetical protein n=1 Tax=Gluconobacter wancherniae TaxID=1307955 RepID=UPI0011BD9F1D|nr:hypothetical protein [Gluconobacter wancherniae]MBF0853181.1 hypothetical protein [Gluconobacter wancherniae]